MTEYNLYPEENPPPKKVFPRQSFEQYCAHLKKKLERQDVLRQVEEKRKELYKAFRQGKTKDPTMVTR